jgi:putative sigma-54 modulation protein
MVTIFFHFITKLPLCFTEITPSILSEDNFLLVKGNIMKINISGHHVEITEGIQQSIEDKFKKVAKHYPSLTSISAIITVEPHQQKLEVSTHYEGNEISVTASGKELYAAIASAAKKMEAALAHRKGVLAAKLHKKYEVEQSDAFLPVE